MDFNRDHVSDFIIESGLGNLADTGEDLGKGERVIFNFTHRTKTGEQGLAWSVAWAHHAALGLNLTPGSERTFNKARAILTGADYDDAEAAAREDLQGNNLKSML